MVYAERLPPHDTQAEESVIGSILIDGDALSRITQFLRPTTSTAKRTAGASKRSSRSTTAAKPSTKSPWRTNFRFKTDSKASAAAHIWRT